MRVDGWMGVLSVGEVHSHLGCPEGGVAAMRDGGAITTSSVVDCSNGAAEVAQCDLHTHVDRLRNFSY